MEIYTSHLELGKKWCVDKSGLFVFKMGSFIILGYLVF